MKIYQLHDDDVYIPKDRMANLQDLCDRLTKLEEYYGKPFIVSSGYRSIRRHKSIYKAMNDKRFLAGKDPLPIPMGSKHLLGKAADIYDPDPMKDLRIWLKLHSKRLEEIGLWCEEYDEQPRVHFQSVAPKSGARFFKP